MTAGKKAVERSEPDPAERAGDGKYVYCIVRLDRSRELGEIGIGGGARVYSVTHDGLAAVVSDTSA